jgi:signal transduction histidine kinase
VGTIGTLERDEFAVRHRPVPVERLLADAAAFARTLAEDYPLTIARTTDERVLADPERIGQVLRNLLGNAAKYSPPGTPITLRAERRRGRVRIEVEDKGPGIHPADLPLIFEKFGRGVGDSANHIPGVGLGLYLSRRIVQAHGAELTVVSTPGAGSTFGFELEVAP